MAKFFFDLDNGDGFIKDVDGRDLRDEKAAHKEVAAILVGLASDEVNGADPFHAQVTVRDEKQSVVFKATLEFQVER